LAWQTPQPLPRRRPLRLPLPPLLRPTPTPLVAGEALDGEVLAAARGLAGSGGNAQGGGRGCSSASPLAACPLLQPPPPPAPPPPPPLTRAYAIFISGGALALVLALCVAMLAIKRAPSVQRVVARCLRSLDCFAMAHDESAAFGLKFGVDFL
jgi:hypothetical protein